MREQAPVSRASRPMLGWLLGSLALVAAYVLSAYAARPFFAPEGSFSIWFPPAGVAFLALVLGGARYIPAFLVGRFIVVTQIYAVTGPAWKVAAVTIALVGIYSAAALAVRRRLGGMRRAWTTSRIVYLVMATLLAALGAAVATLLNRGLTTGFGQGWPLRVAAFAIGDAVAVLMLVPVGLFVILPIVRAVRDSGAAAIGTFVAYQRRRRWGPVIATAILVFAALVAEATIVNGEMHAKYLVLFPLAWLSLRERLGGAAFGIFIANAGLAWFLPQQGVPFSALLELQVFLLSASIAALLLGALETDRARARSETRRSEQHYRGLVETAHEGIVTLSRDGRITYANPRMSEIIGVPARQLLGAPVTALVLPDCAANATASVSRWLDGRAQVDRLTFRRPDATPIDVLISASPMRDETDAVTGVLAMVTDITDQVSAERALLRSSGLFTSVIRGSRDGIVICEAERQHILEVNDSWLHMTGLARDAVVGQPYPEVCQWVAPLDGPRLAERLSSLVRREAAITDFEFAFEHASGTTRHGALSAQRLEFENTAYIVSFLRDVTERRTAEDRRRQSQRLEAIGRLAGAVAHDFNNLLTVIHSYCELLSDQITEHDPRQDDVRQIRSAAERATELTRQLLTFSRQQVVQPMLTDPGQVLRESEKMLRRLVRENIRVAITIEGDLGLILADPGQLVQVMLNLVVNAGDAMPTGGTLSIAMRAQAVDADFAQSALAEEIGPGRYLTLEVQDSGVGMTAEVRQRVFEPFFTTKPPGQGTGLGLATVHGIVRQAGGTIHVDSAPGRGARFTVLWPLVEGEAPVAAVPHRAPAAQAATTILLVEDEPSVRSALARSLTSGGYAVREAGDASEAIRVLEMHDGEIGLVLSDMIMPGVDGSELARRLHASHPRVPVILMSGYTSDVEIPTELPNVHPTLLLKPFTTDVLRRLIAEVLRSREGQARPA